MKTKMKIEVSQNNVIQHWKFADPIFQINNRGLREQDATPCHAQHVTDQLDAVALDIYGPFRKTLEIGSVLMNIIMIFIMLSKIQSCLQLLKSDFISLNVHQWFFVRSTATSYPTKLQIFRPWECVQERYGRSEAEPVSKVKKDQIDTGELS